MPETLPLPEQLNTTKQYPPSEQNSAQVSFEHVLKNRQEQLASVRGLISKKLFFSLEERLLEEKQTVNELLGFSNKQQSQKNRYTHILDPQYFEQKLL